MQRSHTLKRFVVFLAAAATLGAVAVFPHSQAASAASNGAAIYASKCASCHGANGQGLVPAFPPLAGNPVVTGDPKKVVAIINNGLNGKITVNGKDYNGAMPAWKGQLKPTEISAVATYIRSSWGNKASAVR
ncbi:MAG: cytochrome c [Candidatus Baltobacteraceae bacterium]